MPLGSEPDGDLRGAKATEIPRHWAVGQEATGQPLYCPRIAEVLSQNSRKNPLRPVCHGQVLSTRSSLGTKDCRVLFRFHKHSRIPEAEAPSPRPMSSPVAKRGRKRSFCSSRLEGLFYRQRRSKQRSVLGSKEVDGVHDLVIDCGLPTQFHCIIAQHPASDDCTDSVDR